MSILNISQFFHTIFIYVPHIIIPFLQVDIYIFECPNHWRSLVNIQCNQFLTCCLYRLKLLNFRTASMNSVTLFTSTCPSKSPFSLKVVPTTAASAVANFFSTVSFLHPVLQSTTTSGAASLT